MAKLPELGKEYEGDPVHYFIGVARNIFLEHLRQPRTVPVDTGMEVMAPDRSDDEAERRDRCLQHCLTELDVKDRQLIEDYYLHRGATKIACRRELAEKLGVGPNALRIRAYRIRQRLNRCVMACLSRLEK